MTIATNAWINPRSGETRHYINGFWADMLGLHIERYNTGNISYASIDGEKISNGRARRLTGKLWADENGKLHLDYFNGDNFYTEAEALERITKYITENGGLDFLAATEEEEEPAATQAAEVTTVELTEEEIQEITTVEPSSPAHTELLHHIATHKGVSSQRISEAYMQLARKKASKEGTGKAPRMARAAFRWAQEIMAQ